jgi:hypothetical protein
MVLVGIFAFAYATAFAVSFGARDPAQAKRNAPIRICRFGLSAQSFDSPALSSTPLDAADQLGDVQPKIGPLLLTGLCMILGALSHDAFRF